MWHSACVPPRCALGIASHPLCPAYLKQAPEYINWFNNMPVCRWLRDNNAATMPRFGE
jgi:hypothetical protein